MENVLISTWPFGALGSIILSWWCLDDGEREVETTKNGRCWAKPRGPTVDGKMNIDIPACSGYFVIHYYSSEISHRVIKLRRAFFASNSCWRRQLSTPWQLRLPFTRSQNPGACVRVIHHCLMNGSNHSQPHWWNVVILPSRLARIPEKNLVAS